MTRHRGRRGKGPNLERVKAKVFAVQIERKLDELQAVRDELQEQIRLRAEAVRPEDEREAGD